MFRNDTENEKDADETCQDDEAKGEGKRREASETAKRRWPKEATDVPEKEARDVKKRSRGSWQE